MAPSDQAAPADPQDPEDVKIITLARAARARTDAAEAACVRDTDGRTYAGTNVSLPGLVLSGVAVAVAMAVSSGAQGLEAVALCSRDARTAGADDQTVVAALATGTTVPVFCTDAAGAVVAVVTVS